MSLCRRCTLAALALLTTAAHGSAEPMNLLLNPRFEFHSFANHRDGRAVSYESGNVAFWNTDAWGDIRVAREAHAPEEVRPDFSPGNLVSLAPGKRFWQFFTLPEAELAPGETVSLFAYGWQPAAGALRASIRLMKLDSEDGEWTPTDYGMSDERTFPRHSRGEPVVAQSHETTSDGTGRVELRIDGAEMSGARRSTQGYDLRNSWFRHGNLRLGDRHILEVAGAGARLTCVDAKVCPNRRLIGVGSAQWDLGGAPVTELASEWGAPFGGRQAVLEPGGAVEIDMVATDISVAWVDAPGAGTLRVLVDGEERLVQPADEPFTDCDGNERFLENRRGVLGLGYGLHRVRLEAVDAPVAVLGVLTYDSRSNRDAERRLTGLASPGDTIHLTPAFGARPLVIAHPPLAVRPEDVTREQVTFAGDGPGGYEVIVE